MELGVLGARDCITGDNISDYDLESAFFWKIYQKNLGMKEMTKHAEFKSMEDANTKRLIENNIKL